MATNTQSLNRTPQSAAAMVTALAQPLDFIAADHRRERQVCGLIDRLVATSPIDSDKRRMMLDFLNEQLPQHMADEEIDLFPLMIKRCALEEDIDSVISLLAADHAHFYADVPAIAALIDDPDADLSPAACARLTDFATQTRRHLIVENAIILPLARAHLTRDDLKRMTRHMLERRGIDPLQETDPC